MEILRKNGRIAIFYLNGAFSDYRFAVVDLKGLKRIGYYKTLAEAEKIMGASLHAFTRRSRCRG